MSKNLAQDFEFGPMTSSTVRRDPCKWIQDEDGVWDTQCGNRWEFLADGPRENKVHFCPYCGGALRYRSYRDTV